MRHRQGFYRSRRCRLRGFTLLEVVVALVVLSVLTAAAVPVYSRVVGKAQMTSVLQTALAIDRAATAQAALSLLAADDMTSQPNVSYVSVQAATLPHASSWQVTADLGPSGTVDSQGDPLYYTVNATANPAVAACLRLSGVRGLYGTATPGACAPSGATALTAQANYQTAVLAADPQVLWPLTDPPSSTQAVNQAKGHQAGNYNQNNATVAASKSPFGTHAIAANGTGPGVDTSQTVDIGGGFTFQIWVDIAPIPISTTQVLEAVTTDGVTSSLTVSPAATSPAALSGSIGACRLHSSINLAAGWHDVAMTYTPTGRVTAFYNNGGSSPAVTASCVPPQAAGYPSVGGAPSTSSAFAGNLAEASIDATPLSAQQLAQQYRAAN